MIDTPSFKGGVYPRRAICRRGFLSVVVLCGPRVTLSVVGSGSRVTLFVVVLCGSRVTLSVVGSGSRVTPSVVGSGSRVTLSAHLCLGQEEPTRCALSVAA